MKTERGARALRRFDRATAAKILSAVGRFAAGFVLAQAKVFERTTPFGAAFAAVCGGEGAVGIFGALGAAVGALAAWRLGDGMKYVAACALALVAAKAFGGTKLAEMRGFSAVVAATSLAVVGFVFVAADGFPLSGTLAYLCEVALAAGCGFLLPYAADKPTGETGERERSIRAASRLIFAALILLGLSSVPFFAGMTVGRIAATVLVLSAASGGMGAGAAAGVALGIVFDIGGGGGFYAMCYGAAGLVAGIAGGGSRLFAAAAYILMSALCALLDGAHYSALYETFVASVLFMLIPAGKLGLADFLTPEETGSTAGFERRELAAKSRALGALLRDSARTFEPPERSRGLSPDRVYLRASARVCKGCALRAVCFERERDATRELLGGVVAKMERSGGVETEELPPAFRARCLRSESLAAALGEEFRVAQLERRRLAEDERRQAAAARRMSDEAALLFEAAEEIAVGAEFDGAAQRAARRALLSEGVSAELTAFRLPNGRLCLELEAERVSPSARSALETALESELREPTAVGDKRALIYERGKFEISAAAATRRKRGSAKNGDCGAYFGAPRGRFACALSDGMGSGEAAAAESERTVLAAERLIEAGLSPLRAAEQILDLALARGTTELATLDLLLIDDFEERAELVKLGAAASYLRADGRALKAGGAPSAALDGVRPKRTTINLGRVDRIVMISDGVCDAAEDGWLRALIERSDSDAETLCREIIAEAARRTDEADDMTAVVLVLERDEEETPKHTAK